MIHPADKRANNPRLQCVCCGEWKRLHGKDANGNAVQRFFGGCEYSGGGDHLAHKGDDYDVCEECCHVHCKKIADMAKDT